MTLDGSTLIEVMIGLLVIYSVMTAGVISWLISDREGQGLKLKMLSLRVEGLEQAASGLPKNDGGAA